MIVDSAGKRPIEAYTCREDEVAFTLTQREADIVALAHAGKRPPLALESLHPWLPTQKYLGDADRGYRQLIAITRRYKRHFFTAAEYCDERWKTICNALRIADPLDARFHAAWHLPLQAAFVLAEDRPDRSVVAIDFNSLYPACMQQGFPDPARFRQVQLQRDAVVGESLPVGLYRCLIGGEISSFMEKHNPFRAFFCGRYLGASLAGEISVDLNEFEVPFYLRHFGRVHLLDAVVSDRVVAHPLALEARRAFSKRQNYKSQKNTVMADREKFCMMLLASCSNRPSREVREFADQAAARDHLRHRYGIEPHAGEPTTSMNSWLGQGRRVSLLQRASGNVGVLGPVLDDGSACHSLGQRVVARARTRVLEEMEDITSWGPDIEICYSNIDSIHFSVPVSQLESIQERVQAGASKEMGGYKIEAITRHGLWLEPGRFWLYDDEVRKFGNRGVGNGIEPFADQKIYVGNRLIDGLHIPIRAKLDLASTMSDTCGAEYDHGSGIVRQPFAQVTTKADYSEILRQLSNHRERAVPHKLGAFDALRSRLERVHENSLATLPRGEGIWP